MTLLRKILKHSRRKKSFYIKALLLIAAVGFLTLLGILIWVMTSFSSMEKLFLSQQEFIPTRIYSDSMRVSVGSRVDSQLFQRKFKKLGYTANLTKKGTIKTSFKLNYFAYPEEYFSPGEMFPQPKTSISLDITDGIVTRISDAKTDYKYFYLEPELVAQLIAGNNNSIRTYLKLSEVPAYLMQAIISTEDERFLEHSGIDPRGMLRALVSNLTSFKMKQGGSTITQQLVKNLYLTREKSLLRKMKEAVVAIIIDLKFSKEEILERYLNEVYFGQVGNLEVHGVEEAARYFFNKSVKDLSLTESATIVGLIRGPAVYSPFKHLDKCMERKNFVLKKMFELKVIAEEDYNKSIKETPKFAPAVTSVNSAPYFVDYVKSLIQEKIGKDQDLAKLSYNIYTTMDVGMQALAERTMKEGIAKLEAKLFPKQKEEGARLEGALVSIDPDNGFVKAMVGGRSYSETNYNRAINSARQMGSTFKPVVYLTALESKKYNPASLVVDEPFTYKYDDQVWEPSNYDPDYNGEITITYSLAKSINVTAAKVGLDVGLPAIVEMAKKLGIERNVNPYPSTILGASEATPLDAAILYSTLASGGIKRDTTPVRLITTSQGKTKAKFIPKEERVVSEEAVCALSNMMRSVFTIGTAAGVSANMHFYYPNVAGKTGTTNDYNDSWFTGFTPDLATVVWTGWDKAIPGKKRKTAIPLTGASGAGPIWINYMNEIIKDLSRAPFKCPENMIKQSIDLTSGKLATDKCPNELKGDEFFIPGVEPKENCSKH